MSVTVRPWTPADTPFLREMLYQSIHVPDGCAPPRTILDDPHVSRYLEDFGERDGDDAVIANDGDSPVGAAFCRRFTADAPGYGFMSTDVPELGMAVIATHRGRGVGRLLLAGLLGRNGAMSLSVSVDNIAARALYASAGFVEVDAGTTAVTMVRRS